MSKELEKATINYAQKVGSGLNYDVVKRSFRAGALWQKKQDELTWQDVKQIVNIADMLLVDDIHITGRGQFPDEQRYYEEVLKIYKEQKNKEK